MFIGHGTGIHSTSSFSVVNVGNSNITSAAEINELNCCNSLMI